MPRVDDGIGDRLVFAAPSHSAKDPRAYRHCAMQHRRASQSSTLCVLQQPQTAAAKPLPPQGRWCAAQTVLRPAGRGRPANGWERVAALLNEHAGKGVNIEAVQWRCRHLQESSQHLHLAIFCYIARMGQGPAGRPGRGRYREGRGEPLRGWRRWRGTTPASKHGQEARGAAVGTGHMGAGETPAGAGLQPPRPATTRVQLTGRRRRQGRRRRRR